MAYHEAFWVLAGTAAPVIGLAHAVLFGRFWRLGLELTRDRVRAFGSIVERQGDVISRGDAVVEATDRLQKLTQTVQETAGALTAAGARAGLAAAHHDLAVSVNGLTEDLVAVRRDTDRLNETPGPKRTFGMATSAEAVSALALATSVAVLSVSLTSVADAANAISPRVVTVGLVAAMAALAWPAFVEFRFRFSHDVIRRIERPEP